MNDQSKGRAVRPPSASAVSARLRRWWIGEVAQSAELRASDLADVWMDTRLQRLDSRLVLFTPFNFGQGDPLEGELGAYLHRRVEELSGGTVRKLEWDFDRRPPSNRRDKSTDLDVYAPGDPLLDEYKSIARRLGEAIPADTSTEALAAIAKLRLVGVSRHRIWLAAPSDPARAAIGKTPGAAYALRLSAQKVQRAEPLLTLVADRTPGPHAPKLV